VRCSRLLPLSLFVVSLFVSISVQAQSSRVQFTQPNRPSNLTQHKIHANRANTPQASGVNFAPVVTYDAGAYSTYSVAVADVNGDGKPDLLVVSSCASDPQQCANGLVEVLLGNGDGTFQPGTTYSTGTLGGTSIAVVDLNGDGKPDLVVATTLNCNCGARGAVSVLMGNGDGTFQPAVIYGTGGPNSYYVVVADLNGDGKPDLVVTDNQTHVDILLGNGDGTFQNGVAYSTSSLTITVGSVAVADLNGDGKPDLAVSAELSCYPLYCAGVNVLLGNGDGSFQPAVTYNTNGSNAYAVAVADLNGDGKPDLAVTSDSSVDILLGNGDGTFQAAVTYGGTLTWSPVVSDVNGDGALDIVAAGNCCANTDGSLGVLLRNGDGTFQTAVSFSSGGYTAISDAVADLNGDGKPDVVVVNQCGSAADCQQQHGSVGVLINISLPATQTVLASSPNPSNFGQSVTFTATVTPHAGGGMPTGSVSFYNGTTSLGSCPLNTSGIAALTTSTLPVGTDGITAAYNGDTNFAPSTSSAVNQLVQGAIAGVSPTSLSFGNQPVGVTSSPQNVILQNTGNIALAVSIGITGTNRANFAQINNCGSAVSAGSSCTITVTFTPKAAGTRTASVSINDNAPGSPQTVPLSGVGTQPAVSFSPAGLTFPTQVVYTASKSRTVSLTNTGLAPLNVTNVAASGPFHQTNNCVSVNPGGSCTITVTFSPTTIGVLTGSLSITDNAPLSPQKVGLRGTGTSVQLTPTSENFGNQPVDTTSLAKTITLSNKGHTTVNFTGITIIGLNSSDFSQTNTCGTSVASGASCFIKVKFSPSATGKRTAAVSVSDNGGGSPQKVSVLGTGT